MRGERGALVMDSFKAHFVDEVVEYMDWIRSAGTLSKIFAKESMNLMEMAI